MIGGFELFLYYQVKAMPRVLEYRFFSIIPQNRTNVNPFFDKIEQTCVKRVLRADKMIQQQQQRTQRQQQRPQQQPRSGLFSDRSHKIWFAAQVANHGLWGRNRGGGRGSARGLERGERQGGGSLSANG